MDDAASSLPQVAGLSPSAPLAAQKTFLLCVGCQKGGTTWLHDYLSRHPNADMGFRKEYHLANRRFDPENDNYLTTSQVRSMYWRAILQGAWIRNQNHLAWLSFLQRPERYFAYFSQLVSRSEAIRVTGDITPSYAGLPVSALEQIRDGITAQGLRIKVLFLMRDPAERVVSAAMMRWRNISTVTPGFSASTPEHAYIATYSGWRHCAVRTRYDLTITRLESVFPPQDLLYVFYEDLFSEPTMEQVTEHLGISYIPPAFNVRVNVAAEAYAPSAELRRRIFDEYRTTYDFIAQRFGESKVRKTWPTYRMFTVDTANESTSGGGRGGPANSEGAVPRA